MRNFSFKFKFKFIFIIFYLAAFTSGCSSLLYYPEKTQEFYKPEKFQLQEENIWIHSSSGALIHGWWFETKQKVSKGTIVHFHGNAENLTSHFLQLSWLLMEGYNYFIFDYPGYGKSEGIPSPQSCVESSVDAIRWIHQNKKTSNIIIYGQSLGGNIALRTVEELKNEIPISALVADSTFLSFQKIAQHKMKKSWITWPLQPLTYLVLSDQWAPKESNLLPNYPKLVIHGTEDKVVEPQWGEDVFLALPEKKELWRIPDGKHIDVFWIKNGFYRKKFIEWLNSNLKKF